MTDHPKDFIEFAQTQKVLRFGEFTLKSGRISPYFFNAGLFNSGQALAKLGQFYAQTIVDYAFDFDLIFGPAYKGIPLAAITAAALYQQHQMDVPYAFNRKEAKDHGEGGNIVGHPLAGRKVLIIDDVITAGNAIRESMSIIEREKGRVTGIVIALDRQERGQGHKSAIQEVEAQFQLKVGAIVCLADLVGYLEQQAEDAELVAKIRQYRAEYGVDHV